MRPSPPDCWPSSGRLTHPLFAAGLLITRGRNVMSSYVDDPEATAKVLHPLEGDDGLPW